MERSPENEHRSAALVIIDDNPGSLELVASALAGRGLGIFTADNPKTGLELIRKHRPQIVITDMVMPGMNGLDLLDRVMECDAGIEVILMTAYYTTESAVDAIKRGASDYLNKPINLTALRKRVAEIVEAANAKRTGEEKSVGLAACGLEKMIGNSPAMWELFSKVRRIAPHFRSVLVTGATGTGKDLVAQALHKLSPAARGHFAVLNCSAVVETLFESELFGHMKGAFTGAATDKLGLFEFAHNGVLFLDEVGDMPMSTQAKLLRALQNQEVQRVGSLQAKKINVRVIAATHQDLRAAIAAKTFREDLYYRLSMVEIHMPSLSERTGDIPLLSRHFTRRFAEEYGKRILGFTPRAEILLDRHSWPGNVRELENAIGHACMMTETERIDAKDLPESLHSGLHASTPASVAAASPVESLSSLDESERHLIVDAMQRAHGNQSEAARILRIGRDALRYKLKKFGMESMPSPGS